MQKASVISSSNYVGEDKFIWGKKYLLKLPNLDNDVVYGIVNKFNLSFPVARVLCARGFVDETQIQNYLFTQLAKDVSHPSKLKGSQVAAERILSAIAKKENILIFGDYDVDGITSTSLFLSTLLPLGAKVNYFLPHRAKDGYGLSSKIVQRAAQSGYKLIVTVDNGITAFDAAAQAKELGIDLIISDHHKPHKKLPVALSIVNPNQKDCSYPYKNLAGVGVIFKLISLIYEKKGLQLPQKAYELLMLGTVADVVPLNGENRFWVRHGLGKVNKQRSYSLDVLVQNARLNKAKLNSLDIGFMIAPQLNALGRLSDPRDAVKFLISSNRDDIEKIGRTLLEMNEARKQVERQIYEEISYAIEEKKINIDKENVIIAAAKNWPPGIIGLVAGKLVHNYGKPSFIFHILKDGTLRGSCRSIAKFDVFNALAENEDLLISFGGHSCAAGLCLKQENLSKLKDRLEEKISKELTSYDLQLKISLDAELDLLEVNKKLVDDLEMLEPFGQKNEQPIFLIKNVSLLKKPKLLKDKHVKCMLFSHGVIKPIIFFNRPDIFEVLAEIGNKSFDVAACVTTNEWNSKSSVELRGLDVVLS
jgi:single-stranded-DNA-specific exonuclease